MFEPYIQPKEKPVETHRPGALWRLVVVLNLVGLVALGAVSWLLVGRPPLADQFGQAEAEVQASLVRLQNTARRDAANEMALAVRQWRRHRDRLQRRLHSGEAADWAGGDQLRAEGLAANLDRLVAQGEQWRLRTEALNDKLWLGLLVEVRRESDRWPDVPVGSPLRLPRTYRLGRAFREGMIIGVTWPVRAATGAANLSPGNYGIVRRILFPYDKSAELGLLHLLGFGWIQILAGYGLCWFGMKFNRKWASNAGLIVFAYLIVFCAGMAGVSLGVLK